MTEDGIISIKKRNQYIHTHAHTIDRPENPGYTFSDFNINIYLLSV